MLEELTSCNFRLEHFLKSFDILRIKLNPINKINKTNLPMPNKERLRDLNSKIYAYVFTDLARKNSEITSVSRNLAR